MEVAYYSNCYSQAFTRRVLSLDRQQPIQVVWIEESVPLTNQGVRVTFHQGLICIEAGHICPGRINRFRKLLRASLDATFMHLFDRPFEWIFLARSL